MNLPELRDCVSGDKRVTFCQYRDLNLWYVCDNGFEFPVPISDTGSGIFMREDKASYFMRWIRKHLDFLKAAMVEHNDA